MYCRNCGTELKPDAAFCKACGTKVKTNEDTERPQSAVPEGNHVYVAPKMPVNQPVSPSVQPWPQQKKKSKKPLLIVLIILLILALAIGAALFFVPDLLPAVQEKFGGSGSATEQTSEAEDEEETEEAEKFESKKEKTEEAETSESTEEDGKEEEQGTVQISGEISGNVDYDTVAFKPEAMDRDQKYEGDPVSEILGGKKLQDDTKIIGSLYSVSENRDLYVEAYFNPQTGEIDRVVTAQAESDHMQIYDSYFENGELRLVWDYTAESFDAGNTSAADKNYSLLYSGNRLVELRIDRGNGKIESYKCADYNTMDSGVQDLFLAREASYLNRAYATCQAVKASVQAE